MVSKESILGSNQHVEWLPVLIESAQSLQEMVQDENIAACDRIKAISMLKRCNKIITKLERLKKTKPEL